MGQEILGNNASDSILGSAGADTIIPLNGPDTVFGGEGDDGINGFMAPDGPRLYPASGTKWFDGEAGNDLVVGGSDADRLFGGLGNDTLYGQGGADTLDGGAGDDLIASYGELKPVLLLGGGGNDSLIGTDSADTLNAGPGVDSVWGGLGNDVYMISDRYDWLIDEGGQDRAFVSSSDVKLPSWIEEVIYTDGATPLPYWINALTFDEAQGSRYQYLLDHDAMPGNVMAYAFPSSPPSYVSSEDDLNQWSPVNAAQRQAVTQALSYLSSLIDVSFVYTDNAGDQLSVLVFANNFQKDSAGYASGPSETADGSDVYLDLSTQDNLSPAKGNYGSLTLIHEIGHALGLKHPFSDPNGVGGLGQPPFLSSAEDQTRYTVMSYTSNESDYDFRYAEMDIAALQYLYGPSKTARVGNDRYEVDAKSHSFIWDGAGADSVDASMGFSGISLSAQGIGVHMSLEAGSWNYFGEKAADLITAPGQFTINFGTAIESAIGTDFSDWLKGNMLDNRIQGLAGSDRLNGGAGSDSLDGGDGIDTAIFEKARSAYKTEKLSQDGITVWKVTDLATGDIDELRHIEKLEFAKASVAGYQNLVQTEVNLDVTGTPAVTYRLYRAAFARDPDLGGLGYWVSELQQYLNPNLSPEQNPYLLDVAKTFVESKEFKDKYGADVDNATYIRNLYKNALGRDPLIPDPVTGKTDAGYTYWVGVLDAKAASRSDLFVYFSESTENKAAVEPIIATGVEYVPWPPAG